MILVGFHYFVWGLLFGIPSTGRIWGLYLKNIYICFLQTPVGKLTWDCIRLNFCFHITKETNDMISWYKCVIVSLWLGKFLVFSFFFSFFFPFYSIPFQGQIKQACFSRYWVCLFSVCFPNSLTERVILLLSLENSEWYTFFGGQVFFSFLWCVILLSLMYGLWRLTDDFQPDVNFIAALSLFNHIFSFFLASLPLTILLVHM